jgi:hypothetical protein
MASQNFDIYVINLDKDKDRIEKIKKKSWFGAFQTYSWNLWTKYS